jgi:hypothetical protein
MKFRLFFTIPLISGFFFVSCLPIPREAPKKKPTQPANTLTSEEQQKIEEQRELMKQRDLEKQAQLANPPTPPKNQTENTVVEPPAINKPKSDYPFGTPVPGKEGYVFSPYNNKLLDVRGIPSGTLVQDTTYPLTEKKYFRVP